MRRTALRTSVLVASVALSGSALPHAAWAGKASRGPSVSVTSTTNGATVTAPFTLSGTASDRSYPVSRVTVAVDGGPATTAYGTSSWSWGSGSLSGGSHSFVVTAWDSAGYKGATSLTLTVHSTASSPAPTDTTPPTVAITSPSSGASESSSFQVSGTASDNTSVSAVQVSVDGGPYTQATGTTSWSLALDPSGWTAGTHTLTAQALDAAGNTATASTSVVKPALATTTSGPDITLNDPSASNAIQLVGRRGSASFGAENAVLYWETMTSHYGVFVRDTATGASAYVTLPVDTTTGWSAASLAMTSATDLWVGGGGGPVAVRHYVLGGPSNGVPTTATLASRQSFGDTDSRSGDIVALRSGAVAYSWFQQGQTGPQGGWISYLPASGQTWQAPVALDLGVTKASKQALAQQPADGSVWLFSEADATGALAVARLQESVGALSLSWSAPHFVTSTTYGDDAPDPENPDLEAVPDPSTGTIALAYQSAVRQMSQTTPVVTGSYPVIARFPAAGSPTFLQLPVYVERISILGLFVRNGETWLTARPVDPATLTYDHLDAWVYRNGAWSTPVALGQMYSGYEPLTAASDVPQATVRMADGLLHQLLLG